MRRLGFVVGVTLPFAALMLSLVSQPQDASAASRPSPPTGLVATSVFGGSGVSVSWSQPASDGGSPILFYVASNVTGKHTCMSINPGPNGCFISGLFSNRVHHIRVQAVNASGGGQAAAAFSVVVRNPSPSGAPAPSPSGPSSPPAGTSTGTAPAITTSATDGVGTPTVTSTAGLAQLPFTGINLATMLLLGLSLVLIGQGLIRPSRRRRGVAEIAMLRPGPVIGGGLTHFSRWLLGL